MLTILSLGDSYTIGEQVPAEENFPNQFAAFLRAKGIAIADPVIVAKTGWTTDELQEGIDKASLTPPYNIVTLLIGVNNQYRGRSLREYKIQFQSLLLRAIGFSGNKPKQVAVLSIPDWGVTPYATGRDREKITLEINNYNNAAAEICKQLDIHYISITEGTREAANDSSLLTGDELHPSGKEYRRWAEKLATWFDQTIA